MKIPAFLRWAMGLTIAVLVVGVPVVRYRWVYTHAKRLREVAPGAFYRCGLLTGDGLAEAIQRYKIRTVINLINEEPDPTLSQTYLGGQVNESAVCKQNGARFVSLEPDLVPPNSGSQRPVAIERYLEILDNPKSYPILLHCRAGLHRTGLFTAIYRMECQHWTWLRAWLEMKDNGFGEYNCFADNPYVTQYLLTYQPGIRKAAGKATASAAP